MTEITNNKPVGKYALNERLYQWLKQFAQLIFPAAITLYITLGEVWNWPAQAEVAATLGAINVFLGVVLKISTSSYNNAQAAGAMYDGSIVVGQSPDPMKNPETGEIEIDKIPKTFNIDLSANDIAKKGELRIKVVDEDEEPVV